MKILKLTPFFHHPDTTSWPTAYDAVGGMQVQTWRQAMWLAREGIQQHVMTIGFPGQAKLRPLHPCLWLERSLVPMPKFRSEFSGLIGLTQCWALATLWSLFRKGRSNDFDAIHAHLDGQIPAMLVAYLAPRLLKRRMILTVHCSRLAVYSPYSAIDRFQHRFARWLESKAVEASSAVIALTHSTACVLSKISPHVEIIPDAIDIAHFPLPSIKNVADFRKHHGLERVTVGFVGRIAKEKGWHHLIPLAEALRKRNCELLIIGDGIQRERFQKQIEQANLQDWVTITGFIANNEVPTAMASCRLIVMPSLYEEFGGVSIEALATGIPVVAFAVGGLIEILGGITPDLLVAPEDTRELITRVLAVLAGDHAHMTDPAKLIKYAMERYCQEEMGGRLLTLYQVITES